MPFNRPQRWTLLTVCAGTFMLLLDVTIVNVALPDIQRDLQTSFTDLQWVVDAYVLTLAAMLLTAGSLGDRLGNRNVYVAGLAVFTASSLACAVSSGSLALDIARAAQGVGGALMFATSLALLAGAFSGRERGAAFGVYGATTGAAVALGPLIGGVLTEWLGWEWVFYINVPIGVLVILGVLAKLQSTAPRESAGIDIAGLVTFSGALSLLVLALIRGNDNGWGSAFTLGCLGGAALLLVLFVIVERQQDHAMLDLSLFRVRSFVGAAAGAFALSASIFSVFLYLTLYLQNVLGYSPLQAGLRFLPLSLLAFVAAAVSGPLTERAPRRILVGGGLTLAGVALLLLRAGITADSPWTSMILGFVIGGIGVGLVNPALASTAIDVVDPRRSGMASGINSTFRQVGIATGIAGLGALFAHRVQDGVATAARSLGLSADTSAALVGASSSGDVRGPLGALAPEQAAAAAAAVRAAFIVALDEVLLVAACVAFVGAVLSWLLINRDDQLRREPAARTGEAVAAAGTDAAHPLATPA